MSESSATIGLSLTGHTLVEKLGEGGMGEVYLAQHDETGDRVAVKFLTLNQHRDRVEQRLRFTRETNLMTQLRHPHIVAVLGQGELDSRPYLLLEYVAGGNLRDRMLPERPLSTSAVRPLVAGIVEALAALEQAGIVHRDLKPENVLLDERGHVKITDFGIAVVETEIGQLTKTAEMLGTIDYMAPEQRARLPLDARVDQYSLAVIVYEMLTGKRPVGHFKPPSQLNRRLHSAVDAALMRALREDPDDRYDNIRDFASALDSALLRTPRRFTGAVVVVTGVLLIACLAIGGLLAAKGRAGNAHPAHPVSAAAPTSELLDAPLVERPVEAKYYLDRGDAHLENGRDREAESAYTEAIRLNPGDPLGYLKRAYVFKKNELYQKAIDDLDSALRLTPDSTDARTGRGSVYVQLKDYEKSLPDLDRAIELDPQAAEPHAWRGWARYKLDQRKEAMRDFTEAVRLDPDCGTAYQFRALVHLNGKRWIESKNDLQNACRCMPDSPHAHTKLSDLLALCPDAKLRDPKQAVVHATKACELTQWKGWNELRFLARAHASSGDLASAIACCEKAIGLAPELNRKALRVQLDGYRTRAAARKPQP